MSPRCQVWKFLLHPRAPSQVCDLSTAWMPVPGGGPAPSAWTADSWTRGMSCPSSGSQRVDVKKSPGLEKPGQQMEPTAPGHQSGLRGPGLDPSVSCCLSLALPQPAWWLSQAGAPVTQFLSGHPATLQDPVHPSSKGPEVASPLPFTWAGFPEGLGLRGQASLCFLSSTISFPVLCPLPLPPRAARWVCWKCRP